MAFIPYTETRIGETQAAIVSWSNMSDGDEGETYTLSPFFTNKSVQVIGPFGPSGRIEVEGSNAPQPQNGDWLTLHNRRGSNLSFTTKVIEEVEEHVRHIRPRVDKGQGLTVHMLFTSSRR